MGAAEETKKIKRFLVFVLLPIILYGVGLGKLLSYKKGLEEDINTKRGKVKHFYDNGFNVPTKENIEAKLNRIEESRGTVESITSYSSHQLTRIPDDVAEPSVFFKEKLYLTQKELGRLAGNHGVEIPENIGFAEELPDVSLVPVLLLELEMVDKLMRVMIENKANRVDLVEHLEVSQMRNSEEELMPAKNMSVRIHLSCQLESLRNILYEVGNMNPFVVVEGLKVEQTESGIMEVDFHITQLIYSGL